MMKSLFLAALLAVGCGGSSPPASGTPSTASSDTPAPMTSSTPESGSGTGCKDKDGKVHAVGEEWNDGCNQCSCGPNGAKCTRRACN